MMWALTIQEPGGAFPKSAETEAEDWQGALSAAVQQGHLGGILSDLFCEVAIDGAVTVTDGISKRVVALRPAASPGPSDEAPICVASSSDELGVLGIERRLFDVFEAVQSLDGIGDRDAAASALSTLAAELIACDTARCLFELPSTGLFGLCRNTAAVIRVSDRRPRPSSQILCAPIQLEGVCLGMLELRMRGRGFTAADARVLSYLATSAAEHLLVFQNL